jgi:hypothetical protein
MGETAFIAKLDYAALATQLNGLIVKDASPNASNQLVKAPNQKGDTIAFNVYGTRAAPTVNYELSLDLEDFAVVLGTVNTVDSAPYLVKQIDFKTSGAAPVTMSATTNESGMAASNKWRVHFVMPSQYTMATIPQPKNSEVKLREVPGQFFAVHSYTGFNTQGRVQGKTDELSAWVLAQKLKPIGNPQLSRYDPPWTLPMFRRNEIMVEIEPVK